MKAFQCLEFGDCSKLSFNEISEPIPNEDEVKIAVKACGLNFPDILMIQGKYQYKPPLPFVPGIEFSGIVSSIGNKVTNFDIGDHVVAISVGGGFGEFATVKSTQVYIVPKNIPFLTSASTLYNYSTAYHALVDRAMLKKGETLLVLGAGGGVGLASVSIGKLLGAKVIAVASTDEKLKICNEKGADYLINCSNNTLREDINKTIGGKGIDVILDPVGGKDSEVSFRTLSWKGRYLVVGFTSGTIQQLPANLPLLKGGSIIGVSRSGFALREPKKHDKNMKKLINWLTTGIISQYIYKTYPFSETPIALDDMKNRKIIGKSVILL